MATLVRSTTRPAVQPSSSSKYTVALVVGFVGLVLLTAFLVLYSMVIQPWHMRWGATDLELAQPLPGDATVPAPSYTTTRAVTVGAPADQVWPWIAQLGQGRGGLYSYDWLENLLGCDLHSADRILPEFQQPQVGDRIWLARGIFGDTGPSNVVRDLDPGRALVLGSPAGDATYSAAYVVEPIDAFSSRLLIRERTTLDYGVIGAIDFVMQKRTLVGIRARAEHAAGTTPAYDATASRAAYGLAEAGWIIAAAGVLAVFLRRPAGRLWLVLPVAAVVPGWWSTSDHDAALAGFLAVGITVLGALVTRRWWWAVFLPLGLTVLAVLALATDAWIAFGLLFDVLALLILAALCARRRWWAGSALLVFATLCGLFGFALHPWIMTWGATAEEQRMVLPGDTESPSNYLTRAITIDAPPAAVWPWLQAIGQDRGGFFSNDWLENLAGGDIHNVSTLQPEWPPRAVGDKVPMAGPVERRWGGDGTLLTIRLVEPEYVIADLPGRFVLEPVGSDSTRLLVREQPAIPERAGPLWVVWDPLHFVMEQRMLQGIKERAEGTPLVPPVLQVVAQVGWLAAGVAVLGGFLTQRRWIPWLALPGGAVAWVLVMTGDLHGALAGFLAAGITIGGALAFGWRWWPGYLLIASAVALVLLLAPDSYAAFGLVFLAAIGLVWRQRSWTASEQ